MPAARLLLYERVEGRAALLPALEALGYEAVRCRDARTLLEEAMRAAPDAVIYDLTVGDEEDLQTLELLRRAAPAAPLVIVASEGSLMTQRQVQKLRPMFYMVEPVEGAELGEVVEAALRSRARKRR